MARQTNKAKKDELLESIISNNTVAAPVSDNNTYGVEAPDTSVCNCIQKTPHRRVLVKKPSNIQKCDDTCDYKHKYRIPVKEELPVFNPIKHVHNKPLPPIIVESDECEKYQIKYINCPLYDDLSRRIVYYKNDAYDKLLNDTDKKANTLYFGYDEHDQFAGLFIGDIELTPRIREVYYSHVNDGDNHYNVLRFEVRSENGYVPLDIVIPDYDYIIDAIDSINDMTLEIDDEINEINASIGAVINKIKDNVTNVNTLFNGVNIELSRIKTELSGHDTSIQNIISDINVLDNKIDDTDKNVLILASTTDAKFTNVYNNIYDVSISADTIKTSVKNLSDKTDGINQQLVLNKSDISGLTQKLTAAKTELSDLIATTAEQTYNKAFNNIVQVIDKYDTSINKVITTVNSSISNKINTVSDKINTVSDKIQKLDTSITSQIRYINSSIADITVYQNNNDNALKKILSDILNSSNNITNAVKRIDSIISSISELETLITNETSRIDSSLSSISKKQNDDYIKLTEEYNNAIDSAISTLYSNILNDINELQKTLDQEIKESVGKNDDAFKLIEQSLVECANKIQLFATIENAHDASIKKNTNDINKVNERLTNVQNKLTQKDKSIDSSIIDLKYTLLTFKASIMQTAIAVDAIDTRQYKVELLVNAINSSINDVINDTNELIEIASEIINKAEIEAKIKWIDFDKI